MSLVETVSRLSESELSVLAKNGLFVVVEISLDWNKETDFLSLLGDNFESLWNDSSSVDRVLGRFLECLAFLERLILVCSSGEENTSIEGVWGSTFLSFRSSSEMSV